MRKHIKIFMNVGVPVDKGEPGAVRKNAESARFRQEIETRRK